MSERRQWHAAAVALFLLVMLLLAAYFGSYFALSVKHPGATSDDWCRIFRSAWLVEIYKPAAQVESALTGDEVITYYQAPGP